MAHQPTRFATAQESKPSPSPGIRLEPWWALHWNSAHLFWFAGPGARHRPEKASVGPARSLQWPLRQAEERLTCDTSSGVNYPIRSSPRPSLSSTRGRGTRPAQGPAETLIIEPDLQRRRYTVPDNKNRYTGVLAPPGDLSVSYTAEVDLQVHRADPATVEELPLPTLPLDILPFLLPSRFVSSDRLAPFAEREFGRMPKGASTGDSHLQLALREHRLQARQQQ